MFMVLGGIEVKGLMGYEKKFKILVICVIV